jgi:threonine efflux protein
VIRLTQTLAHFMYSIIISVWMLHIVATITPGANTLLVSQLAASNLRKSAMYAALGVAVGSASWAALAVLGVNIIFIAFPVLRLSLQIVGGLYLLYLAIRLWRSGASNPNIGGHSFLPVAAFRLGLLTNFTNPKAALFFGSVFSTCFPSTPDASLCIAVVAVIFFNSLGWYSLLVHLFSRESVRVAYLRRQRAVAKVAGIVLGSLGFRFLLLSFQEVKS